MENEITAIKRRNALLEGNIFGMSAIISALLTVVPLADRQSFLQQTELNFERLEATMLAEDGPDSEAQLRGMRNLRTTFGHLLEAMQEQ